MSKIVRPAIDPDLVDKLQQYANENHNGRLVQAVNEILRKALEKKE